MGCQDHQKTIKGHSNIYVTRMNTSLEYIQSALNWIVEPATHIKPKTKPYKKY